MFVTADVEQTRKGMDNMGIARSRYLYFQYRLEGVVELLSVRV